MKNSKYFINILLIPVAIAALYFGANLFGIGVSIWPMADTSPGGFNGWLIFVFLIQAFISMIIFILGGALWCLAALIAQRFTNSKNFNILFNNKPK